jgi:hypothetical protein
VQNDKPQALGHLEQALEKNLISTDFVLKDPDWSAFYDDLDFKALIKRYQKR